ncbi:MAG: hypothetical protein HZA51_06555 [Planctomycetes bacterium]|nr:hypothetical protein [Planctomycetota bacterium]
MDVLNRIKRLAMDGAIRYTEKALGEMALDGLRPRDVAESILNAHAISKTIRSTSPNRRTHKELLYVIKSQNFSGASIYTKGKIDTEAGREYFYVLISAKIDDDVR